MNNNNWLIRFSANFFFLLSLNLLLKKNPSVKNYQLNKHVTELRHGTMIFAESNIKHVDAFKMIHTISNGYKHFKI